MDILLGLQWGDEGKGKIVDYLAPRYDVVARFQGGPNAGHTLEFDGKKMVLHQIPSGIFRPHTVNVIGNGVVLDLITLHREIQQLSQMGVDVRQNLFISKKAHLILPSHRLLDAAWEKQKGDQKIGSTLRGIGPTYQDKTGRLGLRIGDILYPDFRERYQALTARHKSLLDAAKFEYDLDLAEFEFFKMVDMVKTLNLVDSEYLLADLMAQGKTILGEGAQGSLLDVDFGSYPFVTSSNTFAAGAHAGLGIAPRHAGEVLGIFKAYCTRVGSGPFPTELHGEDGEHLRQLGHEFGATTGRPRRTGWLDLPALRYSVMINGVTQLLMTKADVLNTFEQIQVCTHYRLADGALTDRLPYDLLRDPVEPVYQTFPGWQSDLSGFQDRASLPAPLRRYLDFVEEAVGVPIRLLSVGPDRTQSIEF